ncbi:uncharacterized protein [Apostichopus japonicus]|uniref:uncharacterized protein n=1 Tax=Stichopus japonicus TaxID=307972 RepID=UPI003AB813F5
MASHQVCVKLFAIFAITICLSAQLVSSAYVKWPTCSPGGMCLKRRSGHTWRCRCPNLYPTRYGPQEMETECQFVHGKWKFMCRPSGNDVDTALDNFIDSRS